LEKPLTWFNQALEKKSYNLLNTIMDKDAKLIFESYKNRVVLNEAAAGAVAGAGIAAVDILVSIASVAGLTGLASYIKGDSTNIRDIFKTFSNTSKIEEFENLAKIQDESIQQLQKLLNYAKSLKVPAISSFLSLTQSIIQDTSKLEYNTSEIVDSKTQIEMINGALFTLQELCNTILILIPKMGMTESLSKIIVSEINQVSSEIASFKAEVIINLTGAHADRYMRGEYDVKSGGGPTPTPPPKKDGFLKKALKFIWSKTKKLLMCVCILGLFVLFGYMGTKSLFGGKPEEPKKTTKTDSESRYGKKTRYVPQK
jgi:hypothetical protein